MKLPPPRRVFLSLSPSPLFLSSGCLRPPHTSFQVIHSTTTCESSRTSQLTQEDYDPVPLRHGHVHEAVEEVLERHELLGDVFQGDVEVVADL